MKGSIITLCIASVGILPAVAIPQNAQSSASLVNEREAVPCGPPSKLRRWADAMNPCNLLETDENGQSCHAGNRERCSCGGHHKNGGARLLKRVVCTLCRLPKVVNVPINRGCPLVPEPSPEPEPEPTIGCPVSAIFGTTPAPSATGSVSATATASITTTGIVPQLTQNAILFQGGQGWTLSSPEDSNHIFADRDEPAGGARLARGATYYPPTPSEADELIDVLAGGEPKDQFGRVPVTYQADFDNYGVSALEMADFWLNNPNGMRVVRLKQANTLDPEIIHLNRFVWGKADSKAPNNTYYAESFPNSVFPPSFGIVLCGQSETNTEVPQVRFEGKSNFKPVNTTLWAVATNAGLRLLLNNTDFQREKTFNHQTLDFCELFFGVPA